MGRASRGLAAVVLVSLLPAVVAAADDGITSVTIGPNGPDRSFPLRSQFYITAPVGKDVQEVHPVFVRYQFPPWGIKSSWPSCSDVSQALKADPAPNLSTTSGIVEVGAVWHAKLVAGATFNHLNRYHEAYLPNFWTRQPTDPDNVTYKVLVPQTNFFKDGAYYCLLLYRKRNVQAESKPLDAALETFLKDRDACDLSRKAGCMPTAEQKLRDTLGKVVKDVVNADDVLKNLKEIAAGQRLSLDDSVNELSSALAGWPPSYAAPSLGAFQAIESQPLAGMLLAIFGQTQYLQAAPAGGAMAFFTPDAKIRIRFAQLRDDNTLFVAAHNPVQYVPPTETVKKLKAAEASPSPEPDFRNLALPSFTTTMFPQSQVSIEDVIQLTQGRIRVNGAWGDMAPFTKIVQSITGVNKTNLIADDVSLKTLTDSRDLLLQLENLLQRAKKLGAVQPSPGLSASDDSAYFQLAQFLGTQLQPLINAVDVLYAALNDYVRDAGKYTTLIGSLRKSITDLQAPAIDMTLGMNRNTWLFSYLTIVTGFTAITRATDTFWLNYLGLQIYLWPNPADQPMWTNGKQDWRRIFALELGIASQNGPFGPDNRYSGFSSLNVPPVFIGISAQLIPYVTTSFGLSILGSKRSTLPQERVEPFYSPYFGLSVQFNIPDAILAIKGRTVSTTPPQ